MRFASRFLHVISPFVLALALAGCSSSTRSPHTTSTLEATDQTPSSRAATPEISNSNTRTTPANAPHILAYSRDNNPIHLRTTGTGDTRVLIIGLIHGNEVEGFIHFDKLWNSIERAGFDATISAIPNMNPDGYKRGIRGNADRIDLNRNWPASNFRARRSRGSDPLSEPETAAVHEHIFSFNPDLIVVFHSARSGPFVDPDGPADDHARAFVDAAQLTDPRWRVVTSYTNPPGSLGTYLGIDNDIPVLTVEFRSGQSAESAHLAAEAGTRAAIRTAISR